MIVLREHTAKGDYTRRFGSHEMFTRADMRRQARREMDLSLLHWMRANRPKTIEVLSVIVIASMIFSLISSLLFGMHIVNPIPALLILVTFIGFFAMAKSAERSNADR